MLNRGIYKNPDNSVGIIIPSDEALAIFGLEKILEKDVPAGLPYWMVSVDDIPESRTFRDCWEIDESLGKPNGFGGESNEFDGELLKAYYGEVNDNTKDMLLESQRLIDEQKAQNETIRETLSEIEELVK